MASFKNIDQRIKRISVSYADLQASIAVAVMDTTEHAVAHGDMVPMLRLINALPVKEQTKTARHLETLGPWKFLKDKHGWKGRMN